MSETQFYERRTMGGLSSGAQAEIKGARSLWARVGGLEGDVGLLAQVRPLFVIVGE